MVGCRYLLPRYRRGNEEQEKKKRERAKREIGGLRMETERGIG
jgi:hypothetical protein